MDEELPIDALSYIDTEYSDNAQMQQSVYVYVCLLKSRPALTRAPLRISRSFSRPAGCATPHPSIWRFAHIHLGHIPCLSRVDLFMYIAYMFSMPTSLYVCHAARWTDWR
jgi:hypothetical protein